MATALTERPQARAHVSRGAEPLARIGAFESGSTTSNFRKTSLGKGVCAEALERLDKIDFRRREAQRGERLFNAGDKFSCLYSIRTGFFKTCLVDGLGREQVTGFFMPDELLGVDGLGAGSYNVCAIALDDSDVWAMPYSMLETMAREVPSLHRSLNTVLAQEIVRSQGIMLLLGSMGSRERVAAFLLNFSRRLVRRCSSGTQIQLPMTRDEIGSYLGLTIETVSRVFSSFQREGLMEVRQRNLRNIDIKGLERVLARNDGPARGRWADVCEPGVY